MKVYMFNTYEEDGPTNIKATSYWPDVWDIIKQYKFGKSQDSRPEEAYLRCLCDQVWSDDGLPAGTWNLSKGWGGLQFHVIELDDSNEKTLTMDNEQQTDESISS